MSERVANSQIEKIVGVPRQLSDHYGRAVSDDERFYVLHSERCKDIFKDLRHCPFSIAMDTGIDIDVWDLPVLLDIDTDGWLVLKRDKDV